MSSPSPEVKPEPTSAPLQDMVPQINANSKKRSHSEVVDDARDVKKPKVEPANARDKRRKKRKSKRKPSVVAPDGETNETTVAKTRSMSRLSSSKPLSALASAFVPDAITRGTRRQVDDLAFLSSSSSATEARTEAALATTVVTTLSNQSALPVASGSGASSPVEDDSTSQVSEIARLKKELASQALLIQRHQAHLDLLQNSLTCQICLDIMQKPFVLSPCGHVTCYTCLVRWFTAPQTGAGAAGAPDNNNNGNDNDNAQAPGNPHDVEHILNSNVSHTWKRKTCPICRAAVKHRPIEVWGIKDMAQNMMRSNLVDFPPHPVAPAAPASNNEEAKDKDLWRRIFPSTQPTGVERTGIWDDEDGVFRCLDCHHEIWDHACAHCGRVYPDAGNDGGDGDDFDDFGFGGALGIDFGSSDEDDDDADEDIYGDLHDFMGPFSDDSMSDADPAEPDAPVFFPHHIHEAWLAQMLPAEGEHDDHGYGSEYESEASLSYIADPEGEVSDEGGSFIGGSQEGDHGYGSDYQAWHRRAGYGATHVYMVDEDGDEDDDSDGDDAPARQYASDEDEIEVGPIVRSHGRHAAQTQYVDLEASSGSEEDLSDGDETPQPTRHATRAGHRILSDDEEGEVVNTRALARRLGGRARLGRRAAVESSEDED